MVPCRVPGFGKGEVIKGDSRGGGRSSSPFERLWEPRKLFGLVVFVFLLAVESRVPGIDTLGLWPPGLRIVPSKDAGSRTSGPRCSSRCRGVQSLRKPWASGEESGIQVSLRHL